MNKDGTGRLDGAPVFGVYYSSDNSQNPWNGTWTYVPSANMTGTAATSSKILIMGHFTGSSTSSDVQFLGLNLYRDSTAIGLGDASSRNGTEGVLHTAQFRDDHYSKPSSTSFHFVDSPSSTSSITYRLKCFANHVSGSSLSNLTLIQNSGGYNYNNKEQAVGTTTLILMEIGA